MHFQLSTINSKKQKIYLPMIGKSSCWNLFFVLLSLFILPFPRLSRFFSLFAICQTREVKVMEKLTDIMNFRES